MKSFEEFEKSMSKMESEAWDWIIRLDADEPMSDREKSNLIEWLSRSPAHIEQIRSLNEFWGNTLLTELAVPAHTQAQAQQQQSQSKTSWFQPAYAFACVLLLSVITTFVWMQDSAQPTSAFTQQQYASALGEQQSIKLIDGSVIQLNSDSQLTVHYSETTRDIWLVRGEAHFEVKKDKSRPFNVYASNGRVQAVGTAFTVDLTENNAMNVLVTEGRIALAVANIDKGELKLNQMLASESKVIDQSYKALMENVAYMDLGDYTSIATNISFDAVKASIAENIVKLNKDELEIRQAWQNGEIVFTGQSLEQVIGELKRYSPMNIELADASLAQLKIGGRFKVDRIDAFLQNLEVNFNVTVHKTALDKVVISRN
ncbi:FecR family protein [Catenovulum agarivorans]|uniref:FecR family protein n=1 Tax=Catenovulum agarivorans TaxID=1172192 RepID=UPI0002E05459|nr:FecR domain-containing protein [Catenovulum agarivorans]